MGFKPYLDLPDGFHCLILSLVVSNCTNLLHLCHLVEAECALPANVFKGCLAMLTASVIIPTLFLLLFFLLTTEIELIMSSFLSTALLSVSRYGICFVCTVTPYWDT